MRNDRRYICCLCLTIGLCTVYAGCIVIPMNSYTYGSRQNVKEEVVNTLQLGTTTKDDVFLGFGEPDIVSDNANCITYTWEKVKLFWLLAGGAGGAGTVLGGTVGRKYDLFLCFDDQGLLTQKELTKKFK
jgi:hypothetical protein